MSRSRRPPESAQPDFLYDSFCTFSQSSVWHYSSVFAVASSTSVSVSVHHQVIRAVLELSMLAPIICGNSCSALKEEPLYDFPLNFGRDDPALCPMRCFCISAIGIESLKAANLPLIYQSCEPELVPVSKPDNIISSAPEHKKVVFTKFPKTTHDTS